MISPAAAEPFAPPVLMRSTGPGVRGRGKACSREKRCRPWWTTL